MRVSRAVAEKLETFSMADVREEHIRGSGPGGQHRNKVATGVRFTHLPTGIQAEATDSRSQAHNKKTAFRKLVERLIERWTPEVDDTGRGPVKRIRTYNEKRREVKDHRTGVVLDYHDVLDGNIQPFIDAMAAKRAGEKVP